MAFDEIRKVSEELEEYAGKNHGDEEEPDGGHQGEWEPEEGHQDEWEPEEGHQSEWEPEEGHQGEWEPEEGYQDEWEPDSVMSRSRRAAKTKDGKAARKARQAEKRAREAEKKAREAEMADREAEDFGGAAPAAAASGWLRQREGLWAAFCVPVIVMIVIFVQRGIFPFGEETFLRTDLYHQYAPFFSEFRYKLSGGGSLLYSWDVGMGVNFSALYAYYLASPLNWLLVLCPKAYVIEFMTYSIVLKIGLSGLSFAWYLKQHSGRGEFGIAFFGICYALSGYMAAYSWNIMWLDCILLFPLVMLGLEKLVRERKGLLYSVTLGLCILSNYYISIMICIFMIIYFAALLVLEYRKGEDAARYLLHIGRFAFYSLIGGGLAAVVLLPEIFALQMTASSDFSFPRTVTSYFSIFDMLARHMGNVKVEIGLDHWPNLYCGVAVFLFLPLHLMCREIPARRKAVYWSMLFLFYASFSINVLNFIWHGFHYPNSLPCRQSFIYIFLVLSMCYEAYSHLREMEWKQVAASFFGAVGFILLAEKLVEQEHFSFYVYYVAILFLAAYAALLYLYKHRKMGREWLLVLALSVVTMETALNTAVTSVTTTSRTGYLRDNEDVRNLTESLPRGKDFYRIEKITRKTKNDGAWMNFPSVSLFSSTANADLTAFFKAVGCEGSVNAYSITGSTPLVDSLFSVRYALYSEEQWESSRLSLVRRSGDTWLYQRYYTLPLGFLLPEDFEDMWARNLGNPALVQNSFCDAAGAEHVLTDAGGENNGDSFSFTPVQSGEYYALIGNRQVEEVEVRAGGETRRFSNVDRGYFLELGWCDAGAQVDIYNEKEGEQLNAEVYLFNDQGLKSVYEILNRYPFQVSSWQDDRIEGVVNTERSGVLFTSIPYDRGWTVAVDGRRAETVKLFDAFMGIPVEEGLHTVTMSYLPPGLEPGILITLGSVCCLLAAALAGRIGRRKREMRRFMEKNEEGAE